MTSIYQPPSMSRTRRSLSRFAGATLTAFWRAAGWALTGIGLVGIVVPLLPTTPFLILAAAAFARGDPRIRHWLVSHPSLGPAIEAWERHRAIPRRARRMAYAGMTACLGVTIALSAPLTAIVGQTICLTLVALFIATRPEGPASCPAHEGHLAGNSR